MGQGKEAKRCLKLLSKLLTQMGQGPLIWNRITFRLSLDEILNLSLFIFRFFFNLISTNPFTAEWYKNFA